MNFHTIHIYFTYIFSFSHIIINIMLPHFMYHFYYIIIMLSFILYNTTKYSYN